MPGDVVLDNLLTAYGEPMARYTGQGILTLGGGREIPCIFEAGQLKRGKVLLFCHFDFPKLSFWFESLASGHRVETFVGTTSEGSKIVSRGPIIPVPNIGEDLDEKASEGFLLRELCVELNQEPKATIAHFGLTNFEFGAIQEADSSNIPELRLGLQTASGVRNLFIRPVQQYEITIKRLKTVRSIDVTCEAIARISQNERIEQLTEAVSDVCYLLSVARGTKIQWIYRDEYDETGFCVARTHASTVTKPYCPLAVIDPAADSDTKRFLEQTYPVYISKRDDYRLNRGTIDAYLDAKAENDYLETRAVKLAVAMEMLKNVFVAQANSPAKEFIIEEKDFESVVAPISDAVNRILEGNGIDDKGVRQALNSKAKIRALNRRSFRYVIKKICGTLELNVSAEDLDLFVKCRNALVHNGRFYCATVTTETASKVKEYGFLVNFLDRIHLKLLGYSGPYINRRTLANPTRVDEV
jgi:hypothetical protein